MIDALLPFLFGQQNGREPLKDVGLLIAVEAARNAAAKNPPIDFALHLIAEGESGGVDAAGLLDAKVVARKTKPGSQAKARQVEPARFVRRVFAASFGEREQLIGQSTNSRERPRQASQSESLFETSRQLLGRQG